MLSPSAKLSPPGKGGYSTGADSEASEFVAASQALGPNPRFPAKSLDPPVRPTIRLKRTPGAASTFALGGVAPKGDLILSCQLWRNWREFYSAILLVGAAMRLKGNSPVW